MVINVIGTGSTGNCTIVSDANGNSIILDCGLPFEKITSNPNFPKFSKIEFVFVSHCH